MEHMSATRFVNYFILISKQLMLKYTWHFLNLPNTWKTMDHPTQSNTSVPSLRTANANLYL